MCQYSSQGPDRCVRALALAMAGSTEGFVVEFSLEGYLDAHVRKLKVAYGNIPKQLLLYDEGVGCWGGAAFRARAPRLRSQFPRPDVLHCNSQLLVRVLAPARDVFATESGASVHSSTNVNTI